jgi:hypothetical protein
MAMRSIDEVTKLGRAALVAALGAEDAERFIAHCRATVSAGARAADARADKTASDAAEPIPPMSVDDAHDAIRDMHDPLDQQHML